MGRRVGFRPTRIITRGLKPTLRKVRDLQMGRGAVLANERKAGTRFPHSKNPRWRFGLVWGGVAGGVRHRML